MGIPPYLTQSSIDLISGKLHLHPSRDLYHPIRYNSSIKEKKKENKQKGANRSCWQSSLKEYEEVIYLFSGIECGITIFTFVQNRWSNSSIQSFFNGFSGHLGFAFPLHRQHFSMVWKHKKLHHSSKTHHVFPNRWTMFLPLLQSFLSISQSMH